MTHRSQIAAKTWAETGGTGRTPTVWGISGFWGQFHAFAGTIFIITITPLFVQFVNVTHTSFGGSVLELLSWIHEKGISATIIKLYPTPSFETWLLLVIFGVMEAFLQLALPGKTVYGPVTPKGNTPEYKANGVQAFLTTLVLFGGAWYSGILNPARIYDLMGEILSAMNVFAFGLCIFFYFKGKHFPSTSDSGTTGSIVYDFYWGTELYPRIGKNFDFKTWTNCRVGMMSWPILILCYAAKQYEINGYVADSMIVSIALMQIYVVKFFLWEGGYWCSMDIQHDRAGYYLCWGCLNWVPGIYTSPVLYLVKNPLDLGMPLASIILSAGVLCVLINYDADRQRQEFRKTHGKIRIWGQKPRMIRANYETDGGNKKTSLLLASGWWGISRHFHYIPEILGAFLWTVPGLFDNGLQYFYVIFLTLLLVDRAYRDDERCRSKYGKSWDKYCKLVPFKLIPGVF